MWNRFKTLDLWLYSIPLILMSISVVIIYAIFAESQGGGLAIKQGINALLGLLVMIIFSFIDYRSLKSWWVWLFVFIVLSLIAVQFLGKSEFGAQSWIDFKIFQYQPSELAKFILTICLAAILSKTNFVGWRQFILASVVLLGTVGIIAKQPDFGTALIVLALGIAILMYAKTGKIQKGIVIGAVLLGVLAVSLSFKGVAPFDNMLKSYQKDRLASFIDPSRDKTGSGYNVQQSVIAVGSGGLTGKGLGQGSQSQLNFLPVPHADFIFAVIAEAWGLVGALGIIFLLIMLVSRVILGAGVAKDDFGRLVCIGIAVKLLIEILINIGMNIRIMPVTGIPLPFLSYGGATMITNSLCIGIIQSIVIRYKRLTF